MSVIVTSSDHIPTRRIVQVIGNVSAKKVMWISERPDQCTKKLKEKAREMGANAIINFAYERCGFWGWHGTCRGLAVKVEDEKDR